MQRTILLILVLFLTLSPVLGFTAETWKTEFEEICANVPAAPSLSTERIEELIRESKQLMITMEEVQDPQKKIYLFRLKKCRDFLQYILDNQSKAKTETTESPPKIK